MACTGSRLSQKTGRGRMSNSGQELRLKFEYYAVLYGSSCSMNTFELRELTLKLRFTGARHVIPARTLFEPLRHRFTNEPLIQIRSSRLVVVPTCKHGTGL